MISRWDTGKAPDLMSKDLGPELWNHLPGGRAAAPGRLRIVQALVNTVNLESGQDALATPEGLGFWLDRVGFDPGGPLNDGDARRARDLREALRVLLTANAGRAEPAAAKPELERAARDARLTLTVSGDGGLALEPQSAGVDGCLGMILAAAHAAVLEGTWPRLKTCRECRWAFYDRSKNRAGSWCSMDICGNRRKTRAYRVRRRA
jgi:predicted RNA-binding Zn ribbon-like protein